MKVLGLGLLLAVAVAAVLRFMGGPQAALAGLIFGAVAAGIQAVAVAVVRPVRDGRLDGFMKRWGVGMALRLGGVILFVAAVMVDRAFFPPVSTAFGFLGVLIPLLFAEPLFLR